MSRQIGIVYSKKLGAACSLQDLKWGQIGHRNPQARTWMHVEVLESGFLQCDRRTKILIFDHLCIGESKRVELTILFSMKLRREG